MRKRENRAFMNVFLPKMKCQKTLKEGQIISEAHACYVGGGMVETGFVTPEDYCNNNFATIIRAHLINECFARHLIPISSCDEANIASARVSEKLGFEEQIRYQFLRLT